MWFPSMSVWQHTVFCDGDRRLGHITQQHNNKTQDSKRFHFWNIDCFSRGNTDDTRLSSCVLWNNVKKGDSCRFRVSSKSAGELRVDLDQENWSRCRSGPRSVHRWDVAKWHVKFHLFYYILFLTRDPDMTGNLIFSNQICTTTISGPKSDTNLTGFFNNAV